MVEGGVRLAARSFQDCCEFALAIAFPQGEIESAGACQVSLVAERKGTRRIIYAGEVAHKRPVRPPAGSLGGARVPLPADIVNFS